MSRGRRRVPNAVRTEETRAVLLRATIEAISRYGYQGATSMRIAELSGFTRGAQKHHFDNKAELVSAALVEVHDRWLSETFPATGTLVPGDLDSIVDALWRSLHSDLWIASLELRMAARNDDDLRALLIPVERNIGRRALEFAVGAFDATTATERRVRELADLAFNTLRGMALQRLLYADEDRERRQLRTLTEFLHTSLAADPIIPTT